ncbi:5'/3'-nucleotidase SurE [Litorimonas sp. WD9-15]|uniref:5'/3'-nucleotidase SurE n=1 Tax=Litorimonas sp. WD9-15 TaxID=3418716 RepID=UPI003CFFF5DA
MKILLTNDDGVNARGISVLREIALQISGDVWTCAPDTEQSAASRGVSLHNPVRLKKIDERIYSVTGTPTDSVIVAMKALMPDSPPDLILSGVNRGQNLAEDVTFSGTVAGALQGMQMGVPSVALSLARGFQGASSLPWETALAHGPQVLRDLLDKGWAKNVVPNVNFPDTPVDGVKGVQFTRQGHRDFQMTGVDRRDHPRGGDYFWLTYGAKKSDPPQGTDLRAIYDGYVSITPLHTDLTHEDSLAKLLT